MTKIARSDLKKGMKLALQCDDGSRVLMRVRGNHHVHGVTVVLKSPSKLKGVRGILETPHIEERGIVSIRGIETRETMEFGPLESFEVRG